MNVNHVWNSRAKESPCDAKVSNFHMVKLVIIGVGRFIGGITQFWNHGLVMGKYPYLGSTIWYGVACLCLAFSLAELVSALPFTGGLYGYVRGLMGPYYGFICAVFEVYCNIAAISLYLMGFGKACVTALNLPDVFQLIFFIVPFMVCGSLHFSGKKIFWRGSMIITCIALVIVVLYFSASIHSIRWDTYHANYNARQHSAIDKAQKVVNWQGSPSLFFAGEYLVPALVANEERHSMSVAPITIMWTTFTIFVIAVTIVYISTLQAPGVMDLQDAPLPLNYAFANAFNISYNAAAWLNIPISLASFVIAMYYLIAILKAMASSGLLPGRLLRTIGNAETPYEAIRVTYIGAISITLIYIAASVAGRFYSLTLYTLSTFYLYSLWIGLMVAYLLFRKRYSGLKRDFRSPLGVYGAYIAIFSAVQHFLTQFYPIHGYSIAPFIMFLLSMIALTYIYVRWIIKYQKYSEEEERVFFVTYIVSANRRSQERMRNSKRRAKNHHLNGNANQNNSYRGSSNNHNNTGHNTTTTGNTISQPKTATTKNGNNDENSTATKKWFSLLNEILNPSNVAHRDFVGQEEAEADFDGDEEQSIALTHLKNHAEEGKERNDSHLSNNGSKHLRSNKLTHAHSSLSRIIPTVQVDHSLDVLLDGSDVPMLAGGPHSHHLHHNDSSNITVAGTGNTSSSMQTIAAGRGDSASDDSVELFSQQQQQYSHRRNHHHTISDDHDSTGFERMSSEKVVDDRSSLNSTKHPVNPYDLLSLSDVPEGDV